MESNKKLTRIDLTDDTIFNYKEQPFEWMTKEYGRAEFTICPVWKGNRIKEVLFILPNNPTPSTTTTSKEIGMECVSDLCCLSTTLLREFKQN
jgi:hypothetical protein